MDIRSLGNGFSGAFYYVISIPMAPAVSPESFGVSVVDVVCRTDFVLAGDFGKVVYAYLQCGRSLSIVAGTCMAS